MNFFKFIDRLTERSTRKVAQSSSRRGLLVGVSKLLVTSAFTLQ